MNRKTGYYWVQLCTSEAHWWEIGYYLEGFWSMPGSDILEKDSRFSDIDERPIVRQPESNSFTAEL